MDYTVILGKKGVLRPAFDYIHSNPVVGNHLSTILSEHGVDPSSIRSIGLQKIIEYLLMTKKPQIYAEMSVRGDGSDWNAKELAILGNISIAVPVTVFDNGVHHGPRIHEKKMDAVLVYTCGALLSHETIPDWTSVVTENLNWKTNKKTSRFKVNMNAYYDLYHDELSSHSPGNKPINCGLYLLT